MLTSYSEGDLKRRKEGQFSPLETVRTCSISLSEFEMDDEFEELQLYPEVGAGGRDTTDFLRQDKTSTASRGFYSSHNERRFVKIPGDASSVGGFQGVSSLSGNSCTSTSASTSGSDSNDRSSSRSSYNSNSIVKHDSKNSILLGHKRNKGTTRSVTKSGDKNHVTAPYYKINTTTSRNSLSDRSFHEGSVRTRRSVDAPVTSIQSREPIDASERDLKSRQSRDRTIGTSERSTRSRNSRHLRVGESVKSTKSIESTRNQLNCEVAALSEPRDPSGAENSVKSRKIPLDTINNSERSSRTNRSIDAIGNIALTKSSTFTQGDTPGVKMEQRVGLQITRSKMDRPMDPDGKYEISIRTPKLSPPGEDAIVELSTADTKEFRAIRFYLPPPPEPEEENFNDVINNIVDWDNKDPPGNATSLMFQKVSNTYKAPQYLSCVWGKMFSCGPECED